MQHQASNPASSIWVAASAGTGKTKVLTDRVLRLLLQGIVPSRILCITYTNAAAAEMANRLHEELSAWVAMEDEALKQALQILVDRSASQVLLKKARRLFAEVLDAPEGVRIQTLHGFCQSLLRRFPLEAGLPPHFQVIDERTANEFLNEARLRLFSRIRSQEDPRLAGAIQALTLRFGETGVMELMREIIISRRRLSGLMKDKQGREKLVQSIYQALNITEDATEEAMFAQHFSYSKEEQAGLRQTCVVMVEGLITDKKFSEILALWLASPYNRLALLEHYATIFITTERTPRVKLINAPCLKAYPPAGEILAREQARVIAYVRQRDDLKTAQFSEHVLALAEALLEVYRHLKITHAFLDYDDLVLTARDLLYQPGVAPWILYKLDGGLDHLLIDEAQDTSSEQWALVSALVEEFFTGKSSREVDRTLFVVGDEKQSIYRFQGADPSGFDRMRRQFSKRISESGKEFQKVRLDLSFRSTEPVLQAVDAVFAQEAVREGLDSGDEAIRHEAYRRGAAGKVELWPLIEPESEEDSAPWSLPDRRQYRRRPAQQLARQIAETISEWLAKGLVLPARSRAIRPGDVMILVRKRKGEFVDHLVRALKRHNIPVAGVDRMVLTDNLAVMDLMALGRFVLLPQDDLTLAVLLKSPLLGLSDEELFDLAYDRGEQSLWQRLEEKRHATPVYARCREYLENLLAKADFVPPYEFFAQVLEAGEGRKRFAARLGEECFDPLDEFLAQALAYQETHPASLQGFLHWLEVGKAEIKRDLDQGRNEVRIMTVHGAKGLQAPIVFLPDTTGMPNHSREKLLWHRPSEGNELFLCSLGGSMEGSLCRQLIDERAEEDLREYRRLLYVAMTRAEDQLYIGGYQGDRDVNKACWYSLIKSALVPIAQEVPMNLAGERAVGWQIESAQTAPVEKIIVRKIPPLEVALPAFLSTPLPAEPVLPRPLIPSRQEEDTLPTYSPALDPERFQRGRLVHRLLQNLPEISADRQAPAAQRFLAHHAPQWPESERRQLVEEVLAILHHPQFAAVFGPNSQAEVPVSGTIAEEGEPPRIISGQIDRICAEKDRVLIVDFKTNRQPPASVQEVPGSYLKQMRAYQLALQAIYPRHTVHCALLWTSIPLLMPLPDALLTGKRPLKAAS